MQTHDGSLMKLSGDIPAQENNGEKIIELQRRAEGQAQGDAEKGDEKSVRDSGQSYELSRIREAVENAPDIREEKVALLKKMIASGEYKVNSREVAEKMIKEFLLDDTLKR
jgi:negative regulator of flagellin synthesis FlgM